jgi:hypothetical protein
VTHRSDSDPEQESKPTRPIGARSTFDWIFMTGALVSAFAIAGYLKDLRSDIRDKLSSDDFSRYTLRLNQAAKGTFDAPIWLPERGSSSEFDQYLFRRSEGDKK